MRLLTFLQQVLGVDLRVGEWLTSRQIQRDWFSARNVAKINVQGVVGLFKLRSSHGVVSIAA